MDNKNNEKYKEFLSLKEVTDYLGISYSSVYRYIHTQKEPLPHMKISRKKILVRKSDLEDWLERHKDTGI